MNNNGLVVSCGLRHCFFGDYNAVIGFKCPTPEWAKAVVEYFQSLKYPFEVGKKLSNYVVGSLNSETLDKFKLFAKQVLDCKIEPCGFVHCDNQCQDAEIDNTNHNIDYGASFSLTIPVNDPKQLLLI